MVTQVFRRLLSLAASVSVIQSPQSPLNRMIALALFAIMMGSSMLKAQSPRSQTYDQVGKDMGLDRMDIAGHSVLGPLGPRSENGTYLGITRDGRITEWCPCIEQTCNAGTCPEVIDADEIFHNIAHLSQLMSENTCSWSYREDYVRWCGFLRDLRGGGNERYQNAHHHSRDVALMQMLETITGMIECPAYPTANAVGVLIHDFYHSGPSGALALPDDGPRVQFRCPTDLDDGSGTGSADGAVTIDDLLYYLVLYAAGDARSDVDDGTMTGTFDGSATIDDLLYYLDRYAAGC